ncbi:13889_t:CDS:1, partial [Cetraspora pellucida]
RPVFDWILAEYSEIITNRNVCYLLNNNEFFSTCRQVRSIWTLIKEIIYVLEANNADLADCFNYLIKLAVRINQIPTTNPFKVAAINIFNRRFKEFQHPIYLLSYYIHPNYHGFRLKNGGFREAALIATSLWKSLKHTEQESRELITQLQLFDAKLPPFDLPYTEMDTPILL